MWEYADTLNVTVNQCYWNLTLFYMDFSSANISVQPMFFQCSFYMAAQSQLPFLPTQRVIISPPTVYWCLIVTLALYQKDVCVNNETNQINQFRPIFSLASKMPQNWQNNTILLLFKFFNKTWHTFSLIKDKQYLPIIRKKGTEFQQVSKFWIFWIFTDGNTEHYIKTGRCWKN